MRGLLARLAMLYLQYSPVDDAAKYLAAIRKARNQLDSGLREPSSFNVELRRHAVATSVHYSTRIEGNVLTFNQVESVLRGEHISAADDQRQEVINYAEAIKYAQDVASQSNLRVTEETIRAIHFIVTKSLPGAYEPGQFRSEQNYIEERLGRSIVFRPPPPEDVDTLMQEFAEWLRDDTFEQEPVIKAGLAHLNLVAIHPFADGNGRTARIIEALIFYRAGFLSHELVSLEEFFGQDTESYYAAIRHSLGPVYEPENRDVAMWIDYYLRAHATQATTAATRQKTNWARLSALKDEFDLDVVQTLAVFIACLEGAVTNSIYRAYGSVTNQTAVAHLNQLSAKGALEPIGRGRAARYEPTRRALEVFQSAIPNTDAESLDDSSPSNQARMDI